MIYGDFSRDIDGHQLDQGEPPDPLPCDECGECPEGFAWSAFGGEVCAACEAAITEHRKRPCELCGTPTVPEAPFGAMCGKCCFADNH